MTAEKVRTLKDMITQPRSVEHLWTIDDVAWFLRVTKQSIYNLTHKGEIPFLKAGQLIRFEPDKIRRWLRKSSGK